jgi:Asp-tRNA(Asn)/Glu-tRNA(Gln) amidotransferase A subunit family amidase
VLGNNASATEIELDKKVRENIATAGGEIIDITFDAFTDDDWSKALFLLFYEFNNGLNEYLKQSNSEHKSIDDIIENNLKREDEILKYFGQELMIESSKAAKGKIYEGEKSELIYADATAVTLKAQSMIDKTLEDNSIDLIVGLTRNPAWKIDYENGDNFSNSWGNGSLSAIAGYPHITIPLSYVDGLPVGVSFMASSWEESKIINAAFAFEYVNNFIPRPIRDTK